MSVWELTGDDTQQRLVREALTKSDFPFDLLKPSLEREHKTVVRVTWEDLSRFTAARAAGDGDGHSHGHGDDTHVISRVVDGRARALGLFYLPPHTRVVLDVGLVTAPPLAWEVFLAEAAHAIDYHWMTPPMRLAAWNALHPFDGLPDGTVIPETGDVAHGHSWFDGPGGYSTWVGESMMALLIAAFSPSVPVTINLAHQITANAAAVTRAALLRPVFDAALLAALRRLLTRPRYIPRYLLAVWGSGETLDSALVAGVRRFMTRGSGSVPVYMRAAWDTWVKATGRTDS